MRNLRLLDARHCVGDYLENIRCISIDNDTGIVYAASQFIVSGIDCNTDKICHQVDICNNSTDIKIEGDGIVAIQFIADLQTVCIATVDGTLLQWSVFNNELEEVGCVSCGIKGMCWSPDLELIILTTGDETFILMTREYDPVLETSLHSDEFGDAAFVTVGWGKKETQFHGSVGKGAAKEKRVEVKPVQKWDDLKARVSWRGDGQFFVTSIINRQSGARQLRVWSREGTLHSTSEQVDGLEQSLAWRPSGSLVASAQRSANKHEIVFFEKNGLRHGEFTLAFGETNIKVEELLWNVDSTVLCVWCKELPTSGSDDNFKPKSYVQLWTVNNYHWYQKQSLEFDPDQKVSAIQWDPEHAYRLHMTTSGRHYHQYTWSWTTNCSSGGIETDMATCGVIDGNKVLVTPFRTMVVPPPMSAYNLDVHAAVDQVVFCQDENSNDIAVLLQNNTLAIYTFNEENNIDICKAVTMASAGGTGFTVKCKIPSYQGLYSFEGFDVDKYPLNIYHLLWIKSDVFICCCVNLDNNTSTLFKFQLDTTKNQLKIRNKIEVENYVYNVCNCLRPQHVAVQLIDGTVLKYDSENDTLLPWETPDAMEMKFPSPCSTIAVCQISGLEVIIGLTDRYRFYVNNVEVASNCTSFAIHTDFLLLTTLSHTCRCISLNTKLKDLPSLSDGKEHPFDESIRRVERGSRIVLVVPDDTKLILQMPRGNLEGIYPRALILSAVRHYLDRIKFKEAFTTMKKHRINMNLIYDHNPQIFLKHVEDFVTQINSVNDLNIFLTGLQDEDVTVTMYTAAYQKQHVNCDTTSILQPSISKVDIICDAVRATLNKLNPDKFLLSILTTYVRKKKAELEAALELIRHLKENSNKNTTVSAEEALKYLLFLVDVNELYNVALGTYDFDLVMMVAEKSQKDPKEYIPFLNDLRRMEDNYRKYSIDKHLRRFQKALKHISKCESSHFSECLMLVEDQKLYVEALKCFDRSSTAYKQVAINYGNYLLEKNRHDEAGVMFVKAEEWKSALDAFTVCKNWRQMFCMTARLGYTADKEAELGRKIAEQLKDNRRHSEAAVIFEQYVMDIEEAIVTLVEGNEWDESLRMMYRNRRTDFIETHLKPALEDKYNQEMESLESLQTQFIKYRNRLKIVRHNKERERLEILEGGVPVGADADLFSDTSSAAGESVHSRYTYDSSRSTVFSKMTGKSRKKGSVKKWNLKEGSSNEGCALIEALAKIITSVTGFKDDMNLLLKILVEFYYDDEASKLQEMYDMFLSVIDTSIPEIWLNSTDTSNTDTVLGPNTTSNAIAQAVQQGKQVNSPGEKIEPILIVPPQIKKDIRWKLHMVQKTDTS
ncbi:putative elongator complex protein 1 [Patella vulgata]|uniref:putative elongator complex protein 1 n=1 Tax=Patella vulgata TaxID=6465 RepID=UPI0021800DA5|nr:putative elongator complex protein 1 [Patella vulgata]XP_050400731.1 putative elongator complex protein 1 [Patella vulgata]